MKIAIIGAGGIAEKAYFPLLARYPELEVVSLFSRTQATLDKVGSKWGFKNGTTDLNAVLACKPEAVFVITSNATHYDICKLMLENDIDVYVEKPLASSSAQAYDLARIAEAHQRILLVAFNRRYALLYQKAKEIFGQRNIQSALFQKHRPQVYHTSLQHQYLDDSIHQIDLMRYLCGDLEALCTHYESENGKLTSAVSITRTESGGLVTLINCLQAGAWQESVSLHGEGLTVHVDAFRELRVKQGGHEEIYGTDRPGKWISDMRERGFEGEVEHFLQCVESRQMPQTNALEAAKAQELVEKMVEVSGDKLELPHGDWDKVKRWDDSDG